MPSHLLLATTIVGYLHYQVCEVVYYFHLVASDLYDTLRRPADMTLHSFKRQLKVYLFHILCADEQKKRLPPPGTVVVAFS